MNTSISNFVSQRTPLKKKKKKGPHLFIKSSSLSGDPPPLHCKQKQRDHTGATELLCEYV